MAGLLVLSQGKPFLERERERVKSLPSFTMICVTSRPNISHYAERNVEVWKSIRFSYMIYYSNQACGRLCYLLCSKYVYIRYIFNRPLLVLNVICSRNNYKKNMEQTSERILFFDEIWNRISQPCKITDKFVTFIIASFLTSNWQLR